MKFVALVSGGKDSIYAIHLAIQEQGHELVACVHLGAAPKATSSTATTTTTTTTIPTAINNDNDTNTNDCIESTIQHGVVEDMVEEESYMYQSAGSNVVQDQIQQCLHVPCIVYPRSGRSLQTGLLYTGSSSNTCSSSSTSNDKDTVTDPTIQLQEQQQEQESDQYHDEVDDLYHALLLAKQTYPDIEAVCSGAILSNYQRHRIEYIVCNVLQLHSLAYCWRKATQQQLLYDMIYGTANIDAIIIKTASPPGLIPDKHLNRKINHTIYQYFIQLHNQYQFHICGEGGEYESFVLNASIFTQKDVNKNHRIVIDQSTIQYDTDDTMIGTLSIDKYHIETSTTTTNIIESKEGKDSTTNSKDEKDTIPLSFLSITDTTTDISITVEEQQKQQQQRYQQYHPNIQNIIIESSSSSSSSLLLPHIRRVSGGLYSISEIMCPQQQQHEQPLSTTTTTKTVEEMIVQEIQDIFTVLQNVLQSIHCTAQDIVMVHVYLSDITHFAIINTYYRNFFGIVLPPSRSTVSIGPIRFHSDNNNNNNMISNIVIDCHVQCGSGKYMREYSNVSSTHSSSKNDTSILCNAATSTTSDTNTLYAQSGMYNTFAKLRDVLHVQSISYWAPICVGPYSQVNTIRGCIHFCAGQVGLYPPTMKLIDTHDWKKQLQQCWINIANVLDALDACSITNNLMSCLLYISDSAFHFTTNEWDDLSNICHTQMKQNGNVIPGAIDGIRIRNGNSNDNNDDDQYEDEETRIEVEKNRVDVNIKSDEDTTTTNILSLCPILVVSIPQMPVGALCEIEVVAASRRATNCLQIKDYKSSTSNIVSSNVPTSLPVFLPSSSGEGIGWDTGYDFHQPIQQHKLRDVVKTRIEPTVTSDHDQIIIQSYIRSLGSNATSCALVAASISNDTNDSQVTMQEIKINPYVILRSMISKLIYEDKYDSDNIFHIRLYYINATTYVCNIRTSLQSVLQDLFPTDDVLPAITVTPVTDMSILLHDMKRTNDTPTLHEHLTVNPFFAIQALAIDPVRTEQAVWINEGRKYN